MIIIYHLTTIHLSAITNMVTKQISGVMNTYFSQHPLASGLAQHATPGKIFSVPGMTGSTTSRPLKNHL